jgi:hypothetical protein
MIDVFTNPAHFSIEGRVLIFGADEGVASMDGDGGIRNSATLRKRAHAVA